MPCRLHNLDLSFARHVPTQEELPLRTPVAVVAPSAAAATGQQVAAGEIEQGAAGAEVPAAAATCSIPGAAAGGALQCASRAKAAAPGTPPLAVPLHGSPGGRQSALLGRGASMDLSSSGRSFTDSGVSGAHLAAAAAAAAAVAAGPAGNGRSHSDNGMPAGKAHAAGGVGLDGAACEGASAAAAAAAAERSHHANSPSAYIARAHAAARTITSGSRFIKSRPAAAASASALHTVPASSGSAADLAKQPASQLLASGQLQQQSLHGEEDAQCVESKQERQVQAGSSLQVGAGQLLPVDGHPRLSGARHVRRHSTGRLDGQDDAVGVKISAADQIRMTAASFMAAGTISSAGSKAEAASNRAVVLPQRQLEGLQYSSKHKRSGSLL